MPAVSIKTVNGPALARLLNRQSTILARESEKVLKMAARALAVDYARFTDPPDFGGENTVVKFKERIAREIGYVYPTRDNVGKVFELIKQKDPALANAYYYAAKSGKVSQAAAIMRKAGLPQGGHTTAVLKAARTGDRARIPSSTKPVALLRSSESRALIRGQQNKVGTAKAGWHQAAKAIGGRARTAERLPAYVRAVSRRYNDLGGAVVRPERITIYTNVEHAGDAIKFNNMFTAEEQSDERILKAVRIMVEKIADKFNKTAA